jgi:predicted nucleotidyltransferase
MTGSWYKRMMPRVKDVKTSLTKVAEDVRAMNGVKGIRVWGSYVRNKNNPDYPLRDVDIIAETEFHSEDLLSVMENETSHPLSMSPEELEDEGYNPGAVDFTKKFMAIDNINIDRWAISSDEKLLHLGPITSCQFEWDEIRQEAENDANEMAGVDRGNIKSASKNTQETWYSIYKQHFDTYLKGMPDGWYQSEQNLSEILPLTEKLL